MTNKIVCNAEDLTAIADAVRASNGSTNTYNVPELSAAAVNAIGNGGVGVSIDNTLTVSGKAADAKATGDRLTALSEEIAKLPTTGGTQSDWAVSDESDPAYVKNRTHYEIPPKFEVTWDGDTTGKFVFPLDALGMQGSLVKVSDAVFMLEEVIDSKARVTIETGTFEVNFPSDKIDTVSIPGVYNLNNSIMVVYSADNTNAALGLPAGTITNGVYFAKKEDLYVSHYQIGEYSVKKLDEMYLPDTALTEDDISTLEENRPVYVRKGNNGRPYFITPALQNYEHLNCLKFSVTDDGVVSILDKNLSDFVKKATERITWLSITVEDGATGGDLYSLIRLNVSVHRTVDDDGSVHYTYTAFEVRADGQIMYYNITNNEMRTNDTAFLEAVSLSERILFAIQWA